ncbi:MAG: leucyl aminopeptidase [Candidatus Cloacimonadales bacterium]|jgi:leucyl aminopeptidase|nr:leucyl aminopeptidase [Candidatus Cloacimonadales bacterium]
MKIQLNEKIQGDYLVAIPAWEDFDLNDIKKFIPATIFKMLETWLAKSKFDWKANVVEKINFNNAKEDRDIVLIGLGPKKEAYNYTDLQNLFASIYGLSKKEKTKEINIVADHLLSFCESTEEFVKLAAQTFEECSYEFDTYKEKKNEYQLKKAVLITKESIESLLETVEAGTVFGEVVNLAKQLVNEPANEMTPRKIAEMAQKTGNAYDFEVKVYDEKKISSFGMEAFINVAKGSDNQPRLIAMYHKGDAENPHNILGLIGKGLSFDTGGYNLKPGEGMGNMKNDMAGSAAVIAAMAAISKAKLPINVTAVVAACENMISGRAYRPDDIINTMAGKTVEIISTDAEGRLTLADAIHFAIKHERVTKIVDIATLTGAAVVALGGFRAAVISNDDALCQALTDSEKYSTEKYWRLPADEEYAKLNKSDVADLKNSGGRWAGTISAGLFLGEFVQDRPWMHLDIAGTAMTDKPKAWQQKGATGFAVKSLYYLVKKLSETN